MSIRSLRITYVAHIIFILTDTGVEDVTEHQVVGTYLVIRAAPSLCLLGEASATEFSGIGDSHHILIMGRMEKGW